MRLRDGLYISRSFWNRCCGVRHMMHVLQRKGPGSCRGGQLLSVLHSRAQLSGGDQQRLKVCNFVLRRASVPLFKTLDLWTRRGELNDPYGEFFVVDANARGGAVGTAAAGVGGGDDDWEHRYTLRKDRCPTFLASVQDKVLSCGKYLNVIRGCKVEVEVDERVGMTAYTEEERRYVEAIDRTHRFNSQQLMRLIFTRYQLVERLRSMKHFFLSDHGDFLTHFIDVADEDLRRPASEARAQPAVMRRLESCFDLSVRASAVGDDPFRDDLQLSVLPDTLIGHLLTVLAAQEDGDNDGAAAAAARAAQQQQTVTICDGLVLDCDVPWPVSLVISPRSIENYQLLFRHLFLTARVNQEITDTWKDVQVVRELDLNRSFMPLLLLRQRILHFLRNLQFYITVEVIEPHFRALEDGIREAETLDEVIQLHSSFLSDAVNGCMLTEQDLLRRLADILSLCRTVAGFTRRLMARPRELLDQRTSGRLDAEAAANNAELKHEANEYLRQTVDNAVRTVNDVQMRFNDYLIRFMRLLAQLTRTRPHLMNLLNRIDYNGYYMQQIQNQAVKQQQMQQEQQND